MMIDIIAQNIDQILSDKKISLKQMCMDTRINYQYISQLKRKHGKPSLEKIKTIADYLEVSLEDIITERK